MARRLVSLLAGDTRPCSIIILEVRTPLSSIDPHSMLALIKHMYENVGSNKILCYGVVVLSLFSPWDEDKEE
jgi:hypothetical protein